MAQFRTTYDSHRIYVAEKNSNPNGHQKWRYVAEFPDIVSAVNMRKELRAEGFDVEIRCKKIKKIIQ